MYKPGDWVVYRAQKFSMRPTLSAEAVEPLSSGEGYSYHVVKYWVVSQVLPSGQLEVVTRRGKQRLVEVNDPRLRPATWWERWTKASRFPKWPEDAAQPPSSVAVSAQREVG